LQTSTRIPEVSVFDDLVHDLRHALHQFAASPAFTATIVFTLALGIGATTAMYGIERTLTAVSLDVANPSTLVHVGQGATDDCAACGALAAGSFEDLRESSRRLTEFAFVASWRPIVRGADRAEVLSGARVTGEFFNTLGVHALVGRTITSADSAEGHSNVVVLSESFWKARLGGDSSIVGRTLIIDGTPRVVIGIIPRRAALPEGTAVWAPLVFDATTAANHTSAGDGEAFARLAMRTPLASARAEIGTIGARLTARYPAELRGTSFDAETFANWETPSRADDIPLYIAVCMVLAVACVNLAGLLLARLTMRNKEIAVRAALGASRSRIVRQLLTETILLTLIGGIGGAGVAALGIRFVRDDMPAFITDAVPRWHDLHLDFNALAVALLTSALTGIAVGLWPALRFTRSAVVEGLKAGARGTSAGGSTSRIRRVLVVVEIAFAIALLGAAGLLARSMQHQRMARDGFRSDNALTLRVTAPAALTSATGQRATAPFDWTRLARRLDAVPSVVHATAALGLPYSNAAPTQAFAVEGRAPAAPGHEPTSRVVAADADYFATLDIPIRAGRAFEASDRLGTPRVAIVDARLARIVFGDADPIGHTLVIDKAAWRIVGVAAETRPNARRAIGVTSVGEIYLPVAQRPSSTMQFVLRTEGNPLHAAREATRAVHELDRDFAVTNVQTLTALVDDATAPYRLLTGSMVSFALAAATIAIIGLYGIVSFLVAQRMREFGIRRALGAGAPALAGLVLGESGALAAIGSGFGLLGALGAGKLMRVVLVNVSPADPLTLGGVVAAMVVVAVLSAYGPARRAAGADPMIALRSE
jgi:putative ABC transport system permease protein